MAKNEKPLLFPDVDAPHEDAVQEQSRNVRKNIAVMGRRDDEWFQRMLKTLDERETASNILVSSRPYRLFNVGLACFTCPVGLFSSLIGWNESCTAPLAVLLLLSAVLPLCMAIFLVILIRNNAPWDSQARLSYFVGALYLGVRIVAQTYFWGSAPCANELYYASMFYVALDFLIIFESLCMFNKRFLFGVARCFREGSITARELLVDEDLSDDSEPEMQH